MQPLLTQRQASEMLWLERALARSGTKLIEARALPE